MGANNGGAFSEPGPPVGNAGLVHFKHTREKPNIL